MRVVEIVIKKKKIVKNERIHDSKCKYCGRGLKSGRKECRRQSKKEGETARKAAERNGDESTHHLPVKQQLLTFNTTVQVKHLDESGGGPHRHRETRQQSARASRDAVGKEG